VTQARVELAQQKQTAVAAEMTTRKIRDDLFGAEILESKQLGVRGRKEILCGHAS
jgi:hypothetical protein